MAYNNRNLLSLSSVSQKSKIKVLAGLVPPGNEGEERENLFNAFLLPSDDCWQSWHCLACRHTVAIFASIVKPSSP